jgi:hypothetical protein
VGLAAATAGLVVVASIIDGPPRPLPDVALEWTPLLYVERAALLALLLVAASGIASSLLAGGHVVSFGGGALPGIDLAQVTRSATTVDENVEADVRTLADRIMEVETRLERLEAARDRTAGEE